MSDEADTVVVDCDLDAPPETVWRALTEPDVRSRWLEEADSCAEVVEAEPNESLRLAWRERDGTGALVESEVAFTLTPTISGGTRLRVVHEGFVRTPLLAMARLKSELARPRASARPLRMAA